MKVNSKRKVIIGLGNPGKEYERTRHNAGFMFVDYLIQRYSSASSEQAEVQRYREKELKNSIVYEVGKNLILAKPHTFMNRSGEAVKEIVKWYDVDIETELIIAHDDLDIPLGKSKVQFAKSPGDHKGVNSVEDHLGTTHFTRIRIGVENRKGKKISGEDYVLRDFSEEELITLKESFEKMRILD